MVDNLKFDAINALQHPLIAHRRGGDRWPILDIDVETGLMRIDVRGKLQTIDFAELLQIEDGNGDMHDPDDFYHEDEGTMESREAAQKLAAHSAKAHAEIEGIREELTWITKDGKRFLTLEAAIAHQRQDQILEAIYNEHGKPDGVSDAVCDAAKVIAANAAEIFAILEPFFRKDAS